MPTYPDIGVHSVGTPIWLAAVVVVHSTGTVVAPVYDVAGVGA